MAYVILFFSALVAATILPLQSEAVLVALLLAGDHSNAALVAVATVGNVRVSVVNWILGRAFCGFFKIVVGFRFHLPSSLRQSLLWSLWLVGAFAELAAGNW